MISAAAMMKNLREKSSLSMSNVTVKMKICITSNKKLGNHLFQQLQLDCGADNLLLSSSTGNSVKGINNMLQSYASCNTEEKEPDGDCSNMAIGH
jgi:hypothetical protein